MSATLNIGLTAYHAIGNLVFVKVPSERGRYLLTDMCVIAVSCPHCGAMIGEPCRRGWWREGKARVYGGFADVPEIAPRRCAHGTSVHCDRRTAARQKYGFHYVAAVLRHLRLHLDAGDVEAAMNTAPPGGELEPGADIDFAVTRKP